MALLQRRREAASFQPFFWEFLIVEAICDDLQILEPVGCSLQYFQSLLNWSRPWEATYHKISHDLMIAEVALAQTTKCPPVNKTKSQDVLCRDCAPLQDTAAQKPKKKGSRRDRRKKERKTERKRERGKNRVRKEEKQERQQKPGEEAISKEYRSGGG